VVEDEDFKRQLVAKYGKATKTLPITIRNEFGATMKGIYLEWSLPGLHVRYETRTFPKLISPGGNLLIETETLYRSKQAKEKVRESKGPKL